MGKRVLKGLSLVLVSALVVGNTVPASAATKVKLNAKKINLVVGEKKKIKVNNSKKKVKWSIKSGKKYISLSKKTKKTVVVSAKKEGKAVVQAKIGTKKLTCRVTVKKAQNNNTAVTVPSVAPTAEATVTPVPDITAAPTATPTPTPEETVSPTPGTETESPTPTPASTPIATPEAGKDFTVNLTGKTTTFTASDTAAIDFSEQLGDGFQLSQYTSLDVTYTTQWTDETKKSGWAIGKVAVAHEKPQLDGKYDDQSLYTYGMTANGGTVSVPLGSSAEGTAVGINIQPMMDADHSYKWPEGLESITITKIVFVVPLETIEPLPSVEFNYQGLDQQWIDENIDPSKPIVALSFDDGPGGYGDFVNYGMQIQQALKDAGAHATFFYIGSHIVKSKDTMKEATQAFEWGFELANHSYDSDTLDTASAAVVKEKYEKTNEVLKGITGYDKFLFRAPSVQYSDTMFSVIDAPFIDVSIWSNDWDENVTKEQIVENVKKAKDGDIINMHSVHQKTAEAVPEILAYFEEQGIQVVSVSELFAIRGKKLMTGKKYSSCL